MEYRETAIDPSNERLLWHRLNIQVSAHVVIAKDPESLHAGFAAVRERGRLIGRTTRPQSCKSFVEHAGAVAHCHVPTTDIWPAQWHFNVASRNCFRAGIYKATLLGFFQVATTKEGSGVRITNGPPASDTEGPTCFWWRRGRVELGRKHGLILFIAADAPATEASLILSAVA